jgi:hypothetical protein
MKIYVALVINPYLRTIKRIEMDDDGKLEQHYKIISTDVVELVSLINHDKLWVDENGLFKGNQSFFYLPGYYHSPLAGIAIVVSLKTDRTGNDLPSSPASTQAELEKIIQWRSRGQLHSLT